MKSIRSKGFTLIELLVVIAIIGLLASIILASLNTARMKGRDAARLEALKEIANLMEASNSGTLATAITCSTEPTTTTGENVTTCSVPSGLNQYTDPSGATTICASGQTSPCAYTIFTTSSASANTQNYEICSYLESGSGSFGSGMVNVSASSSDSVTSGCTF